MAGVDKYLNIKYKLKSSEDFDEFLKFTGVGLLTRKAIGTVSPVFEMTKSGDTYTITLVTVIKTVSSTFKLNEEFVDEKPDNKKTKSCIKANGDTLIQTDVADNGLIAKTEYSFTPQLLTLTHTAEGWNGKAVRTYEAI